MMSPHLQLPTCLCEMQSSLQSRLIAHMSHEYDDLIDERGVSTKTSLPRQADLARTRPAELLGNPQRLKLLQGFRDWLPRRAQDKSQWCVLLAPTGCGGHCSVGRSWTHFRGCPCSIETLGSGCVNHPVPPARLHPFASLSCLKWNHQDQEGPLVPFGASLDYKILESPSFGSS